MLSYMKVNILLLLRLFLCICFVYSAFKSLVFVNLSVLVMIGQFIFSVICGCKCNRPDRRGLDFFSTIHVFCYISCSLLLTRDVTFKIFFVKSNFNKIEKWTLVTRDQKVTLRVKHIQYIWSILIMAEFIFE